MSTNIAAESRVRTAVVPSSPPPHPGTNVVHESIKSRPESQPSLEFLAMLGLSLSSDLRQWNPVVLVSSSPMGQSFRGQAKRLPSSFCPRSRCRSATHGERSSVEKSKINFTVRGK